MDAFNRGAEYYEALSNPEGRLDKEGRLLLECLSRAPGSRVLDMACGTGLHALFLAEHGAEVTACDVSPGMLAHVARTRPHERIAYEQADMRSVRGGPWDFAICLGNSLALLPAEGDLRRVFRHAADHLTPGGLWLLQVVNYQAPGAQQPRHRVEERAMPEGGLVAVKSLVPHAEHTYLSINYFMERGGTIDQVSETAVLHHWNLETLERMADECGLDVAARYGGFDQRSFDAVQSSDMVLVLEKRTHAAGQ